MMRNLTKTIKVKYFPLRFWLLILLFIIFHIKCSTPQTKDDYLMEYKSFISQVESYYQNYSDDEWVMIENEFNNFSNVWYDKFSEDFTWKEEILLSKYSFKYSLIKTKVSSTEFFNQYLKDDYKKLKDQLMYYKENDMQEDIDYILDQASEIGESAVSIIEGIIVDLENEAKKTKSND